MPFPKVDICKLFLCSAIVVTLQGCGAAANNDTGTAQTNQTEQTQQVEQAPQTQKTQQTQEKAAEGTVAESPVGASQKNEANSSASTPASPDATVATSAPTSPHEARARLNITEDYREQFMHGEKTAPYQKYIVMHDTEGEADASSVIDWWANNGNLVSSHFVVNKDGSIVQCVPLDIIAHHAGYGDTGHNEQFGVTDESRDDRKGTTPIGDWASDYGMNSYSVGIEMVHSGSVDSDYPEAQLKAVDDLIAYIDSYYGFQSTIIDHNDWRTGNSDCSEAFQKYLENYRTSRTHDGNAAR